MPHFYITGFQMRQFQDYFSYKSLDREGFQKFKETEETEELALKRFDI